MNIVQQKTLHQLTGYSNIDEVPVNELYQLVQKHPYFSIAHFFLSQKLQEDNHTNKIAELQKTALYFNNPYWLQYQLNAKANSITIKQKNKFLDVETKPLIKNVVEEEIHNFSKPIEQSVKENKIESRIDDEDANEQILKTQQQSTVQFATNIEIPTYEKVTAIVNNLQENVQELKSVQVEDDITRNAITSFALETTENDSPVTYSDKNNELKEVENEANMPLENNETIKETENVAEEKITTILKEQLAEFKKPIADNTDFAIETEPYHTVDYFASQGIKPTYEENAQDKLSKQLRKFTDWLKHMKNTNISENDDLGTDPELETAIHGIAQTSNQAKEIVTETMAEVLEKQGKTDKAIQLYIKLSFLNPDKSTYFANKIQKLKGI